MTNSRTIDELNLMDDFLFQEVLSDENDGKEAAKLILSVIMEKEIGDVSVRTQKIVTTGDPDKHAIRMDVYLEEGSAGASETVYDMEVQMRDTKELPQRTRYYQALMDARLLKKGMDYKTMRKLVIILISSEDIFGYDRMRYTFENRCVEIPELALGDGAKKIFLYGKGKIGSREDLRELLSYMEDSRQENAVSEMTRRLHQIVCRVKRNEEVGVKYMKAIEYEDMIRERAESEGRAEGRAEGEMRKIVSLIRKKVEKNMSIEEIADILEEQVSLVEKIYDLILNYPDWDDERIYVELKAERDS